MAERDSKTALGMGSTTAAFIVDITGGITDMRQSLNLAVQEVRNLNQALQITKSLVGGLQLPSMGGQSGFSSSNQVAPNPKFTPPSQAPLAVTAPGSSTGKELVYAGGGNSGGGGGGTSVTSSGGGNDYTGATNLSGFIKNNPMAGTLFASSLISGALKSPADAVEAQLLMQRSSYFSGGKASYDDINKLQSKMGYSGMATDHFDSMRALAAAQSLGITGGNITGAGGVAQGVAATSNLLPGIGMEGTMRAYANMQQPRNVNMLRGIGIQLRDEQGNLKPPSQIIEDLWAKICRDYAGAYGSGKKPSEREVLIGLQPGNSLDSMLDRFFGNDPMAKQLIVNGLLFKAKGGGDINKLTPKQMQDIGATTSASNMFFGTTAESGHGLGLVAASGAAGYESAAGGLLAISKAMNTALLPMLKVLTYANAVAMTLLGAGGGALSKVLGALGSIAGAKAEGGPVDGSVPYIVGEKGPELFVPKKDGSIVPNHTLKSNGFFRAGGGDVSAGGHRLAGSKQALTDEQLRNILTAAGFQGNSLETAMAVARAESGGIPGRHSDPSLTKDDSYGLFQINMLGKMGVERDAQYKKAFGNIGYKNRNSLYDPYINAKIAYEISKKGTVWKDAWVRSSEKLGIVGSSTSSQILNDLFGADAVSSLSALSDAAKALGIDNSSLSLSNLVGSGLGGYNISAAQGNKTVVMNINGAQDTKKVVDEVIAALKKEGFIAKAGKS